VAADPPVVIDTNILFSALLAADGRIHQTLFRSGDRFRICETALVELFEHKERILSITRLTAEEVTGMYHRVLGRVEIFPEALIPVEAWSRAVVLCSGIDSDDVPHVALTLTLNGLLWTGDRKLRRGLASKGFDSFFQPLDDERPR
jgi:predicted nucleic acid-binding protein